MRKFLFLQENDLLLINFDSLFSEIEVNCLNDLHSYGLVKSFSVNLSKRDVKKLIYHHVIYGMCEEILCNKHNYRKVIVLPPKIREFHELSQFCPLEKLEPLLERLLKQLKNSLPFVIYKADEYLFEETSIDNGKMQDMIGILSQLCINRTDKKFTFEKIKTFANKFDLTFLSKEYFNSIKTTLLLH